jgi:hypothetical protein
MWAAAVLLGAAAAAEAWPVAGTITGVAGPPEVYEGGFTLARLLANRAEYEEHVRFDPPEPPVRQWPEALGNGAQYGVVTLGVVRRTFVLTGWPWALIVDVNGNGSLADDARVPLVPRTISGTEMLGATITGDAPGLPTAIAFRVADGKPIQPPFHYFRMVRRGTLPLGERTMAFALVGSGGSFDEPHHEVFFDHDGDGALPIDEGSIEMNYSPERYRVADERVNLDGRSYRFEVDPIGDTLTLTPIEGWLPERPVLALGAPAPGLRFVDIDFVAGSLEDYRGRVVLLYFWYAGCVPCQKLTPHLVDLHGSLHPQGFEILAVNMLEPVELIREYVRTSGLPGRMIAEGAEGEIAKLFRIEGAPSWFLVDRDGRIAGHRTSPDELIRQAGELVRAGASTASPAP